MSLLPGGITLPELAGIPANPPSSGKFFLYIRAGAIRYYDSASNEFTLSTGITQEEVEDIVGGLVAAGSGITVTYNDAGDVLTIALDSATQTALTNSANHIASTSNPHSVTKSQVGLGNVDNTSDADKPVSNATQTALNGKQDLDGDLTAIAALAGTGLITRTATNTATTRAITASTGITVSNGDGVSGNPTVSANPSQIDHDALLNFVANEHIDHSGVSISAGTGLTGGGNITASRTLNLADTAVTPATYGSATEVGQFTVDQQGRITSASNVSISGLGGIQELVSTGTITNNSNVTVTNITDLTFNVVAGRYYRIQCFIRFSSTATGTGIALQVGVAASAVGDFAGKIEIPISTTASVVGYVTATAEIRVGTGVAVANADYLAIIDGIYVCTTSGTLVPQFRSETNGTTVRVLPGSNIFVKEFT